MKTVPLHASHTLSSGGKTIKAGIDQANLSHVMSQLSNLYSNRVYAVEREYSTNAWDSHLAAGVTRPIEVTLPTYDDPRFIVQDFGLGLSLDELEETYMNYGSSSKRHSDDFNGSLGFGSKSGLTYAPLGWQVRSIKNGVQVLAVVSHDEEGIGTMQVLDTCGTEAGNGVTVTIPVDETDLRKFQAEAEKLYYVWRPGTVIVKNHSPLGTEFNPNFVQLPNIWDDDKLIWLDDTVAIGKDIRQSIVIMGNVPYRISQRSNWGYGIVAEVPMGSVHFTPSREDLLHTDHTDETLKLLFEYVDARAEEKVLESLKDGATPYERVLLYQQVRASLHHAERRKLDRAMRAVLPTDGIRLPNAGYTWAPGRRNAGHASVDRLFYQNITSGYYTSDTPIVVTGFPFTPRSLSSTQRARLNRFRDHLSDRASETSGGYHDMSRRSFLVLPDAGEIEMLEGHPYVYDWEHVVECTPNPTREGGRVSKAKAKTTYAVWQAGSKRLLEGVDAADGPVIIETGADDNKSNWTSKYPSVQLVLLRSERQRDRFLRVNPGIVVTERYTVQQDAIKAATEALSDNDRIRRHAAITPVEWKVMGSVWNKIADTELADLIRLCSDGRKSVAHEQADQLGISAVEPEVFATMAERYPLVSSLRYISAGQAEELAFYLNAKWENANVNNIDNVNIDNDEEDVAAVTAA